MKRFFTSRRFHRLNFPGALLLSLLQRTPVLRVAAAAETALVSTPIAHVLRSALAVAASLGAIDSMAGATVLTVAPSSDANGLTTSVGATVQLAFNVDPTATPPASWKVSGTIPAGLSFSGLTSPGTVNVTGNGDLIVTGSPTQSGAFTVKLTAFEGPNGSLIASQEYSYSITVNDATGTAPSFTTQPISQTVTIGGNATFTVAVSGTPAPTLQWEKDGTNIPGATSSTLTLNNVQSADAGQYSALANNSAGSKSSNPATLTVSAGVAAPIFTVQPVSATVATGSSVAFNSTATGATSYQWRLNGTNINGATDALLFISNSGSANAGTYTVVAGNSGGSTTSSSATLTVNTVTAANAGHVTNLSVRTFSGTSDQLLNVGFVIGGANTSGTKPVLVRVSGPALAAFGVGGTMADPVLTIQHLSGPVVASNDDWGGNTTVATTSQSVGAFPFTDPNSADAAVVTSLSGGSYTALAAGKNNTTGIVLTEIYDATPSSSITASTPRLINVSARAQAGTGDGALIAGFAVAGSTGKTLLIRAIGPALAAFGVGGTLADPKLEVYQQNGPKLYENDNWGGSAVIDNVSGSVGAFGIADKNSKDAALLVTLPPGVYTAQVSGVNNSTGVALVEVYDVP